MPDAIQASNAPSLPSPEAWREYVTAETAEARARLAEMKVGIAKVPAVLDADTAPLATSFVAQCRAAVKDAEAARKAWKDKSDALSAVTQALMKSAMEPVEKAMKDIADRIGAYDRKRAAEEQAKREAEAKAKREAEAKATAEAAAKAAEAGAATRAAASDAEREAAARKIAEAEAAEAAAEAAVKDAAKADKAASSVKACGSGAYGDSVSYQRRVWHYDVVDISKVPRSFLMIDPAAVREYLADQIKTKKEPMPVPGLRFDFTHKTIVKGA